MIIKNISVLVVTMLIAVSLPTSASAYFTQAQTQLQLTSSTALYSITYSFGLPNQDLYLPIIAERNLMHDASEAKLGYTIRNDREDVITTGDTASFIYSTAEIKDGMYYVPKGSKASFTLVTLFRTQTGTPAEDYLLLVENLPFLVDIGNPELEVRDLNPSELKYYTTNEVRLNQGKLVNVHITSITTTPPTTLTVSAVGK